MNWDGYDANVREYFRELREDQRLFDVTLATDDGQHIQAHKIILSAGSNFFSDIFVKNNYSNMLIYLKGISSDKLEPIIDFIYNGEAFITHEELKAFIENGKELQIKGLEGKLPEVIEIEDEKPLFLDQSNKTYDDVKEKSYSASSDDKCDSLAKMDEEHKQFRVQNELSHEINNMIEKKKGAWRCKICGKTTNTKSHINDHVERHIEGMSYACHMCSKTFSNRPSLSNHMSRFHSGLFSCNICGKTGMKKGTYMSHKTKNHGNELSGNQK